MNNLLEKICNNKKLEIINNKKKCSYKNLEKILSKNNNIKKEFKKELINSQNNKINFIIGEIKKSSPSAGNIIKDYFPEEISHIYEKSGVKALSILTDKKFFEGELDHISMIKKSSNLPILRKDFIIDEYQILESKVYGADCILLIVSILNDKEIYKYLKIAEEVNIDCIIETHDEEEIKRAINFGYPIIGINNRNLNDLKTDINNTVKLINKIPNEFTIIAESGIKNKNNIKLYNELGIYNFLIGETILKSKNKESLIKELIKI